jgi:hypothetical protein
VSNQQHDPSEYFDSLLDQDSASVVTTASPLNLGLTGISFIAAPLAAGWCVLSLRLGRRQSTLAKERTLETV